ncbi:KCNH2 [Symbiodinium natans]|uniref:KCNH2 protein n=1 Tax=Symbiodinium natans TaxID=878477 RepID=A0A812MMB5_9DINO|nr:KCNH2 [Symbiodinium natans]
MEHKADAFWKLHAKLGEAHRQAMSELTLKLQLGQVSSSKRSGGSPELQDSVGSDGSEASEEDESVASLNHDRDRSLNEAVGSGGFLPRSGSKLSFTGAQLSVPMHPASPPASSPTNSIKRRSATVDSTTGRGGRQRCLSSASFMSGLNPDFAGLSEVGDISQAIVGADEDSKAREIAAKLQEAVAALEPQEHAALLNRHAIPHLKQKLPSLEEDEEDETVFAPRMEWSAAERNSRSRASSRKPATTLTSQMDLADDIPEMGQTRQFTSNLYHPTRRRWPQLVFMPTGTFRTAWDFFNIVVLTLELILLPLHVFEGMVPTPGLIGLSWVIQIFWNMDIVVNFRTGFYMRGNAIKETKQIALYYLRGWLLCDFSNVVLDWYVDSVDSYPSAVLSQTDASVLYYLVITKFILRLVRFAKLNRIAQSLVRRLNSDTAIAKAKIFLLSCQILLMQHVLACVWYRVGRVSETEGWVTQFGFGEQDADYRYTTSLHWMFCQLGFGSTSIEGSTTLERTFGLIVAFLALVVFSTLLGAITSLTTQLNKASEERKHQFRQLRKYLSQHHINEDLCLRITGFLEEAYKLRQAGLVESQVTLLELLSKPLRGELQYARYEKCLEEMSFVRDELLVHDNPRNLQAAKNLATEALAHRTFAPADTIFEAEVIANHAYFLTSGLLVYELNGYKVRLQDSRWLVEMSLWIPWLHLGELHTEDVSSLVMLEVGKFAASIRRSSNGQSLAQA